ncbi:MAG: type II toxin-antitoxin system RelE/ParE family toxin [Candidatus Anammoxibacter sp.]
MIKSFKDSNTQALFEGKSVKKFRPFRKAAERKLLIIDNACEIKDCNIPPGNRLEKLSGGRDGQYSIRINRQWRVCFVWKSEGVYNVEITDYH